jgi:hypothetical protein
VDLGFDDVSRRALVSQGAKMANGAFYVANLTDVSAGCFGAATACLCLLEHDYARAQAMRGDGRRSARGSKSYNDDICASVCRHLPLLILSELDRALLLAPHLITAPTAFSRHVEGATPKRRFN